MKVEISSAWQFSMRKEKKKKEEEEGVERETVGQEGRGLTSGRKRKK